MRVSSGDQVILSSDFEGFESLSKILSDVASRMETGKVAPWFGMAVQVVTAIRFPSWDQSSCPATPVYVLTVFPLLGSHSFTCISIPADAINFPEGDQATEKTGFPSCSR